jgi:hypothetical protein
MNITPISFFFIGIIMILVNLISLLIFFYCGYDLFHKIANKGLIIFQQFGQRNTNEQIFDSNIHSLDSIRSGKLSVLRTVCICIFSDLSITTYILSIIDPSMNDSIMPEQDYDSILHLNTIYDYEDIHQGGSSRSGEYRIKCSYLCLNPFSMIISTYEL